MDYGLLRLKPRNDAVVAFLSLRSLCKRLWQSIRGITTLSLRGMSKANDEAIYNLKYRNFYNGIVKMKGEILDYGLLRFARNDKKENDEGEALANTI